ISNLQGRKFLYSEFAILVLTAAQAPCKPSLLDRDQRSDESACAGVYRPLGHVPGGARCISVAGPSARGAQPERSSQKGDRLTGGQPMWLTANDDPSAARACGGNMPSLLGAVGSSQGEPRAGAVGMHAA